MTKNFEIKTDNGFLTGILVNGKSIDLPGIYEVSVKANCDTKATVTFKALADSIKYVPEDYTD